MNITSFLSLVGLFATTACIEGPELFKQDGSASADYAILAVSENGVSTGEFSAASSATQVMTAGEELDGTSVAFGSGALAIDASVSMQQGSSIASGMMAAELGIGSVSAASTALVVTAKPATDAVYPFTLSIGRSSASLSLADSNLVVMFLRNIAAENRNEAGVIPNSELKITDNAVSFPTRYFGSYQLAYAETKITKAIVKTSEAPILTKNAAAELPQVRMVVGKPTLNLQKRQVNMSVKLSAPVPVVRCSMFVYRGKEPAWFDSDFTDNVTELRDISRGRSEDVGYEIKVKDAIKLSFSFNCMDTNGRAIESARTEPIDVPKHRQNVEVQPEPASIVVRFVPLDSIQQYPAGRIVNSASPTRTISGDCDSNRGPVKVFINGGANPSDSSWPCQNNQFSFPLTTSEAGAEKILLTHNDRGYRISASQGPDSKDETVIYRIDAAGTYPVVHYIDSDNFNTIGSLGAAANNFIILTTDIDLSGGVTAQFPVLDAVFEGDLKEIRNLNSTTGGLFAGVSPTGRIRHLTIKDASVTGTASQSGTLAKSSSGEIEAVRCVNCTVTITGSIYKVGGLVGRMHGSGKLIDVSFNGTVNATLASEVGGIVGEMDDSSSVERALVHNSTVKGKDEIGGIAGQMHHSSTTISKSRVVATLESHKSSGEAEIGGIAGCGEAGTISEVAADIVASCLNSGVMKVGGVVGHANVLMLTHAWSQLTTSTCLDTVGGAVGETSSASTSSYLVTRANIGTCSSSCGIFVGSRGSGAISHAFALSGSTTGLSTVGTGTDITTSSIASFSTPEWITILASEGPILKDIPMLPLGPNP